MGVATTPFTTAIKRLRIEDLELLEVNARFMRHEQFQQLVRNIERDGRLTSVPFAILNRETGRYQVISGNHRILAGKQAGLEEVDVMTTDDPLTRDQVLGIQISHNAITGEDDPATLKVLYEEIESLDFKEYAGIDDKTLKLFEEIQADNTPFALLQWAQLTFSFLPEELEEMRRAFDIGYATAKGEHWLARMKDHDKFQDALAMLGASHGTSNRSVCLKLLIEMFYRNLEQLQEGYIEPSGDAVKGNQKTTRWVPIASVFGTAEMPADVALVVVKAIEKAVSRAEITKESKWRFLELAAASYLAEA